jgi:hypothetical protein
MALVTAKNGVQEVPYSIADGTSVAQVREGLAKTLNLDDDMLAYVKFPGERAVAISKENEATTIVTDGATVEFSKPAGQKG